MLQISNNAGEVALRLRRRASKYPALARAIAKEELEMAQETALKFSSLTDHSLKELAAMGHPYSRQRHPVSSISSRPGRGAVGRVPRAVVGMPSASGLPHPAHLIHQQGGRFRRSWRQGAVRKAAGGYTGRLTNTAPYAGYLQRGTRFMVPRPIMTAVSRIVRAQHARIYRRAYRQTVGR